MNAIDKKNAAVGFEPKILRYWSLNGKVTWVVIHGFDPKTNVFTLGKLNSDSTIVTRGILSAGVDDKDADVSIYEAPAVEVEDFEVARHARVLTDKGGRRYTRNMKYSPKEGLFITSEVVALREDTFVPGMTYVLSSAFLKESPNALERTACVMSYLTGMAVNKDMKTMTGPIRESTLPSGDSVVEMDAKYAALVFDLAIFALETYVTVHKIVTSVLGLGSALGIKSSIGEKVKAIRRRENEITFKD